MADKLCMGCMEAYGDEYDVCPYCGYVDGTEPKEAYHLMPGTVIEGRYIAGKVIGSGGFGVTYIGYDVVLNQKIAIKEYLPGEFSTRTMGTSEVTIFSGEKEEQFASGVIKFVDEARRLAKFKHTPGIVDIHDSFQTNNTAYIIMEYLDGETLSEKLSREGKIPVDEALNIMMPVIGALKVVHQEGILHRDISPDNIIITKQGEVKIIDFGAARFATTTHSRSLSVLVKPGYAPEEQYRSRGDQGPWTDVYACAATLYKMITGVTPEDAMERRNRDTLQPPSKLGVKIPKNKENAIMNALNIRIEDRTQSAEQLEADLTTDSEIKRNRIRLKKMDIGKWPLWLKITSGAATAAVVTLIVLLLTGVISIPDLFRTNSGDLPDGYVYAPNVQNHELESAENAVTEARLITQIVDKQHSDEIAENMVLSQNIPAGAVVKEKTVMELVISAGYERGRMPDITGLSRDEVVQLLIDMGWEEDEIIISEIESEVAPGYVVKQDMAEGEEVRIGEEITLYISSGISGYDESRTATVPGVTGKTWDAAAAEIAAAKLYIYKSGAEYSFTVPKGSVISQDPVSGTEVSEGSSVGVVISLGREDDATAYVPDVQYKAQGEAIAMLEAEGLEVELRSEESSTVRENHVIRQSVAAGSEVPVGTVVVIYISLGNPEAVIEYDPSTAIEVPQATTAAPETNTNQQQPASQTTTAQQPATQQPTAQTQKPTTQPSSVQSPSDNVDSGKDDTEEDEEDIVAEEPSAEPPVQPDPDAGKISVPNIVGMTESEAKSALTSAGLSVGAISYQHDETGTAGTVLSQGLDPGTKVAKDSVVNMVVCDNTMITYYRYRDVTSYDQKTSTTSKTPPTGYTYLKSETTTTYGDWGAWSDWGPNAVSGSDTREVQAESGAVGGRYMNPSTWESHDKNVGGICNRYEWYRPWSWLSKMSPFQWYAGGTERWAMEDGKIYYRNVSGTGEWSWSGTVYRYRDRTKTTTTTYYFQKPVYGSWSSWSTTKPASKSTREIETKQEYMY